MLEGIRRPSKNKISKIKRELFLRVLVDFQTVCEDSFNMSWVARFSTNMQEIRFVFNPTVHTGTSKFIENNYHTIKRLNPRFPFLVRENPGVAKSIMTCRFGKFLLSSFLEIHNLFHFLTSQIMGGKLKEILLERLLKKLEMNSNN